MSGGINFFTAESPRAMSRGGMGGWTQKEKNVTNCKGRYEDFSLLNLPNFSSLATAISQRREVSMMVVAVVSRQGGERGEERSLPCDGACIYNMNVHIVDILMIDHGDTLYVLHEV